MVERPSSGEYVPLNGFPRWADVKRVLCGMTEDDIYPFCKNHAEMDIHILRHCFMVRPIWMSIGQDFSTSMGEFFLVCILRIGSLIVLTLNRLDGALCLKFFSAIFGRLEMLWFSRTRVGILLKSFAKLIKSS